MTQDITSRPRPGAPQVNRPPTTSEALFRELVARKKDINSRIDNLIAERCKVDDVLDALKALYPGIEERAADGK